MFEPLTAHQIFFPNSPLDSREYGLLYVRSQSIHGQFSGGLVAEMAADQRSGQFYDKGFPRRFYTLFPFREGVLMSVYKRGATWRAEIKSNRIGEKPYRVSRTFDTKTEALAFERSQRRAIEEARRIGSSMPDTLTLGEGLDRWWDETEGSQSKSYRQTNAYRKEAWKSTYLGKLPMTDLSVKHLNGWIRDERVRGMSESTLRNDLFVLRALFKHSKSKWGWVIPDPTIEVLCNVGTSGQRDRRLSVSEFQHLSKTFSLLRERQLNASKALALDKNAKITIQRSEIVQDDRPDRTIVLPYHASLAYISAAFETALEAAMRRGKMFSMRWDWINFETRMIVIPPDQQGPSNKKAPAKLPMSPALVKELAQLNGLNSNGSVRVRLGEEATTPVFGPLTADRAYRLLQLACDLLYIKDLHWHDLRHEACSRLAEMGWTIQQIQVVSGHKTLQSLQRYMHVRPESIHRLWEKSEAAAA